MGEWIKGSEIAHAVAASHESPFEVVGTILAPRAGYFDATTCHNPSIKKVDDKYACFIWVIKMVRQYKTYWPCCFRLSVRGRGSVLINLYLKPDRKEHGTILALPILHLLDILTGSTGCIINRGIQKNTKPQLIRFVVYF